MTKTKGKTARRWAAALAVALASLGGNASAILLDRGPDMVYDTVLNITWTRQAGDGVLRGNNDSLIWAFGLVLGGFDDWRLPFASVAGGFGPTGNTLPSGFPCSGAGGADEVACRDNEMAYMFYYNLGGTGGVSEFGNQTAVGGQELTGIGNSSYWSGTQLDIFDYWLFLFTGAQGHDFNRNLYRAWAVRDGDVLESVPEPGSLLLLALGATGLAWSRRRRQ